MQRICRQNVPESPAGTPAGIPNNDGKVFNVKICTTTNLLRITIAMHMEQTTEENRRAERQRAREMVHNSSSSRSNSMPL